MRAEEFLLGGDSASSFAPIVKTAAQVFKVPEPYLNGIIQEESSGNPKALNRESGAAGLMGFMPDTAKEYGIDPYNPQQAIFAGAKKLKGLLDRYGNDPKLALMAYYAGEGNVDAWLKGDPSEVGTKSLAYPGKVLRHTGQVLDTGNQRPAAAAFLSQAEPEQPSIFSISTAHAAEPPGQSAISATDFLMGTGTGQPGQQGAQPPSAEEFLNAPAPEGGMLSDLGTGAKKTAGILAGVLNAPHAFVMGAARPAVEDPEKWRELSWMGKNIEALKAAGKSAYESVAEPGTFGADINTMSKFYTGKSVQENLPDSLKPYSLSIEFLGSILTDPVIGASEASRIIVSLGNKKLFGEMSKSLPGLIEKTKPGVPTEAILADLEKISGLEAQEKAQVQGQLLNLLKNREDYVGRVTQWGESELAKVEMREALAAQPKMLPPGQGFELRGAPESVYSHFSPELAARFQELGIGPRKALPPGQGFELVERTPEVIRVEHGTYPRGQSFVAGVEQEVPTFVKRGDTLQEAIPLNADTTGMLNEAKGQLIAAEGPSLKYVEGEGYSRLGSGNPEWFKDNPYGYTKQDTIQIIDKALSGDMLTEKQTGFVRGILDAKEADLIAQGYKPAWAQTQAEYVDDAFRKMEEGLQRGMQPRQARDQFVAPLERNAHLSQVEKALSEGKAVPDEVLKDYPDLATRYRPDSLKQLFPNADPKYMKVSGGFFSGVGQDENGNITFDSEKALAGGMKILGKKGNQRFLSTLAKNPAWSKVHNMIGQEQSTFSLAGMWAKFNSSILDRFYPLKEVSPKTYEEARKFSSYKDIAKQKFGELGTALSPVRKNEALFTDYATAHRAMDRANRGLANPNGVTLQEARQAIREIETHYAQTGKDPKELKAALQVFQKWTHENILKPALDSGIISKPAYDSIRRDNQWYAAFDVIEKIPQDVNKLPALPGKEFFSVSSQGIVKAMTGTEKRIANPIESTIKRFIDAQAVFARNKVASTFIDDPAVKGLIQPVAQSPKEFAMMQARGLKPVMEGSFDKRAFDTVNRFKDGNVERYVAPKEIADSLKQLSSAQAPKAIQAINNIFRSAATTLYLPFTISNAMRDALMAFTTSKTYTPKDMFGRFQTDWLKGLVQGAKHEFGKGSASVQDYLKSGGGFGYVGELRSAELAKSQLFEKTLPQQAVTVIKSPITLIEKVSAAVELAPRLAVYERALKQGKTPAEAAMMARESTIDFSKGGTLTKVANQFVPFLNARVQGRLKLVEAMKDDPKNTLAKIFMAAVVPGLGAYAWNRLNHSDLYDDIPEHIRQNYFTLITGTTQNEKGRPVPQYLVIAKGDTGQIAFNPIEYMLDQIWQKDRVSAQKFLVNYLSDVSPVDFAREGELSLSKAAGGLLPPVVKGFAEDWANLNLYTGKEIVPYYQSKTKPPELQYRENTPETWKWVGKELEVSPLRLQNFASNILAGYGREGLDPSAMARGLTGRLIKTTGGEKEDRAWTIIKDIENGHTYTRAYAQEMAKNGDRNGAMKLMRKWNEGLNSRISELPKYGVRDKGGLRRDYSFTPEKMINTVTQRQDKRTPLEKKLSIR